MVEHMAIASLNLTGAIGEAGLTRKCWNAIAGSGEENAIAGSGEENAIANLGDAVHSRSQR